MRLHCETHRTIFPSEGIDQDLLARLPSEVDFLLLSMQDASFSGHLHFDLGIRVSLSAGEDSLDLRETMVGSDRASCVCSHCSGP